VQRYHHLVERLQDFLGLDVQKNASSQRQVGQKLGMTLTQIGSSETLGKNLKGVNANVKQAGFSQIPSDSQD
jgi:Trp operon repressor